ncbi:MAG TPA: histidine kinase, partial [Usitatibacteraceae bacterium]|nr:histidine kinase [Usitatibacteraceae bacterium]
MATRSSAREEERLARLAGYRILGTPAEPAFDDLARRAQEAAHAPMAWLAFHDGVREWVKAGMGISFTELEGPRRIVFRGEQSLAALVIEDAEATDLRSHPLVAGEPRVRFLCAIPLV